jgi:hypothetical protein
VGFPQDHVQSLSCQQISHPVSPLFYSVPAVKCPNRCRPAVLLAAG